MNKKDTALLIIFGIIFVLLLLMPPLGIPSIVFFGLSKLTRAIGRRNK